jgi:hypothetical protein
MQSHKNPTEYAKRFMSLMSDVVDHTSEKNIDKKKAIVTEEDEFVPDYRDPHDFPGMELEDPGSRTDHRRLDAKRAAKDDKRQNEELATIGPTVRRALEGR